VATTAAVAISIKARMADLLRVERTTAADRSPESSASIICRSSLDCISDLRCQSIIGAGEDQLRFIASAAATPRS
jgi:hypothetical protein